MVRYPPLVISFTQAHLCDTPFCNILRDHLRYPTKTSTKSFCDTIAASIARYEKYRYWASKVLGKSLSSLALDEFLALGVLGDQLVLGQRGLCQRCSPPCPCRAKSVWQPAPRLKKKAEHSLLHNAVITAVFALRRGIGVRVKGVTGSDAIVAQ